MSQPRRRSGSRRPAAGRRPEPLDIWSPAEELPPVERITMPEEVGALLRSLGEPPAIDGIVIASGYFTAVVERAAAIAAALALSADLLETAPDEH